MALTIISSGESGVNRGALDAAIAEKTACSGWCAKGRQAEDGIIDRKYPLIEIESAGLRKLSKYNVSNSDATVIIYQRYIWQKSESELALLTCIKENKPYLLIDASELNLETTSRRIVSFVNEYQIKILNFTGIKASRSASIRAYTKQSLRNALRILKDSQK